VLVAPPRVGPAGHRPRHRSPRRNPPLHSGAHDTAPHRPSRRRDAGGRPGRARRRAAAEPLPPRLQQILKAQGVAPEEVSIVVRDALTGESHLDLNGRVPRSPASTIKVLTTYAALDELGPAYTWKTRAYATGPIVDGRLRGDLVIQGGGDPFMTAERWWRFARELRNTGLRAVDGDVVLDRTLYAPQAADPDEFDGRGYRTYNVLPDPLLVNLQSVEFHFVPNGGRVDVIVDPEPANFRLVNSLQVTSEGCRGGLRGVTFTSFENDPGRVAIGGRLSSRCPPLSVRRVVMQPATYAYGTFATNWKQLGGEVKGGMRLAPRPVDAKLLLEYQSLTLGEVVRLVNKHSSNAMARTLVLTLGLERRGAPATVANGEQAMQAWLARRGLDFPELVIDNGSGLSRLTRMSADSMARMLGSAYQSHYYPELAASMPLGGLDGTLRNRFADYAEPGRIRLKTGQLNGVSAVGGWVTSRSNRPLTVVVIVNRPGAQYGSGQAVIDTVVRWALDR
jgi:serine-type D-Ala-D-Ala carboxypeptidase/endopeptidase (penicillin-binding protein 4)